MKLSSVRISTVQQASELLSALRCYPAGSDIMAPKANFVTIRVSGLLPQAANILKQEMLAKGGEVAVPSDALRMGEQRVDCVVMGTIAHYDRLIKTLRQQPFELAELAPKLAIFSRLSASRPERRWLAGSADVAVGGLVNCDLQPPGVHDRAANAVALGWNLLEERSDFLVVIGSDTAMVQSVAEQLTAGAACPVAMWVPDQPPVGLAPSMPVVVQQGHEPPSTSGAVLAVCTGEDSLAFIERLITAHVGSERLFITAALGRISSGFSPEAALLSDLPRLDAVIMQQQDIAMLSVTTQAAVITRFADHGTSAFITDIPRHIRQLLDASQQDPWNSSPIQH